MITRRCRGGHSEWELVEKRRPAECEHEQKAGEGVCRRGRVQEREVERERWLMLSTDRKSAELKPSVIEPKSKRGHRKNCWRGKLR